ncbi:MAG: ABC transporter ATP-binding protein [Chitinophagaceae bacterium]|nr:ABC transporter ATP-binding protein [Chitinophagaceae bacterium]MBK9533529.1 ABC transporter ATP-binding protein [Chitinophagaceae bacterium]
MKPLLQVNQLGIRFNPEDSHTAAVKDSSFTVNSGELVAIVGESGSGKSVTALSILQLLPAQAAVTGEVLFCKDENEPVDLLQLPAKKLNRIRGNDIAMIFQEPMTSLNPVFTCGYQVMEAIQLHQQVNKKTARQKAIALFEQVKLPGAANMLHRYPHEISGGQKQRVMIAMAMSCNPALLIADEPTTALDVTVQKTILELIKSLQEINNMGVVFITHDLGVVADIADKILVMYKGEMVEQGPAKEILLSPKHPYTKALLACRPAGQKKGHRLPVVSDFMNVPEKIFERTNSILTPVNPQGPAGEQPATNLLVENLVVKFPVQKNIFGKATQFFNAVDDVSFTVQRGDIIGLVGESGCGKTTLGRTILQLIKPASGQIILNGKDLAHAQPAELRNIRKDMQVVFQDPYGSLNPRITIGEAIMEPLKVHAVLNNNKQRREKVMDLLEKVSLDTDHFNRYPHQFSGGQRQRICIARALALDPSFLIFDEMVSALDVSVQAQVLNLLNDLKKEFGFSAIFISHDLAVVHYICNRILVMQQGKIVEEGEAGQVYHHPKNEYTQKLVDAIPGKNIF